MKQLIMMALLVFLAAGCGQSELTQSKGVQGEEKVVQSNPKEETSNEETNNADQEKQRMVVIYQGTTDSDTFIVDNRGTQASFDFDSSMVQLEQFNIGDLIDVTYLQDGEQMIATEVIGNTGAL